MTAQLLPIESSSTKIDTSHVPSVKLCRYFKKQQYVAAFNKGRYRFGNLKQYRSAELDVRSDPTELESLNYQPDGSAFGSLSTGNYYAICFTELNESTKKNKLAKKFGNPEEPAIQLSIENNFSLTENILKAWKASTDKYRIAYFQWYKVVYSKNEISTIPRIENNQHLHVYQKPKLHTTHRFKRISKTPPPQQCIDLGGDIGSVLELSDLLQKAEYNSLKKNEDWLEIEPVINNFENEQEWRLVFFSGDGIKIKTNEPFVAIDDDSYTLKALSLYGS